MSVTVIASVVLIVCAAAGVAAYRYALDPEQRSRFGGALGANTPILIVLIVLAMAPAAALLPLPDWAPRWLIGLALLAGWGMAAIGFWDGELRWEVAAWRGVIPPGALREPPGPLLPGIPAQAPPPSAPVVDGDMLKSFRWTYVPRDGVPVEMSLEAALSTERYQLARAEARRPAGDWAHYAARDMPELDTTTAAFHSLHHGRSWSTLDQAGNVLRFTQACIEYKSDEETTPAGEWPRYPLETLMDEAGDCEDDAILAAAILKRLGLEVALLYYPGHVALGVAGAEGLPGDFVTGVDDYLKYFYGETTAEGWHLGEVPERYRGRQPDKIEPVYRVIALH